MNATITWGGAGLVLPLAATAFVISELPPRLDVGSPFAVAYGGAVVVATVIAVLLIVPSMRSSN